MRPATICSQCARRIRSDRMSARAFYTFTAVRSESSSVTELESQREAAKQRAWYLPAESTSKATQQSPSIPRFTTFDPLSTVPTPASSAPARPLPSNAPSHFQSLHQFLTTSELLEPSSISFLHTPSSGSLLRNEEELGVGGIGASWEWVIVAVVRGRGKGVVGRAEGAVRVWLKDNPIPELSTTDTPRRMPRIELDTDWSLVQIGQSRTCVNLFTQEGRDKWDLEDLFAAK